MTEQKTDEELVALYQKGNEEALRELIGKYTAPVFNFVAQLTGRGNAADLVQDVFLKVWKNLKRFKREKASFKTWLFTIAKNTALDFLKKKKHIPFSDLPARYASHSDAGGENEEIPDFAETIPDQEILPDQALIRLEDTEVLDKSLDRLPVLYKTILVLHYQEEMTFEEIGKVLGKPLNTVKSYHRRALLTLRKMFL